MLVALGATIGLYSWLSLLIGKQVVEISAESFIIKRVVGGFSRSNEYLAKHIKDFRIGHKPINSKDLSADALWLHIRDDGVAFDYGAKTFHFGLGLDEAKQIVAKILGRFPQYAPDKN